MYLLKDYLQTIFFLSQRIFIVCQGHKKIWDSYWVVKYRFCSGHIMSCVISCHKGLRKLSMMLSLCKKSMKIIICYHTYTIYYMINSSHLYHINMKKYWALEVVGNKTFYCLIYYTSISAYLRLRWKKFY